jgi:hypothetical protein
MGPVVVSRPQDENRQPVPIKEVVEPVSIKEPTSSPVSSRVKHAGAAIVNPFAITRNNVEPPSTSGIDRAHVTASSLSQFFKKAE